MYLYHNLQAYHNELVSKVSHLEEENLKLKKEKVHNPFLFISLIDDYSVYY